MDGRVKPLRTDDDEVGRLNVGFELRQALGATLQGVRLASRRDRFAIAADVSRLSGSDVTKNMLDRYAAPSTEQWRFPAELVPALVVATGDRRVLALLARAAGLTVITDAERRLVEIGRAYLEKTRAEARLRAATGGRRAEDPGAPELMDDMP